MVSGFVNRNWSLSRVSVFDPQTHAYTPVEKPVVTEPCNAVDVQRDFSIHVYSQLQFGLGRAVEVSQLFLLTNRRGRTNDQQREAQSATTVTQYDQNFFFEFSQTRYSKFE